MWCVRWYADEYVISTFYFLYIATEPPKFGSPLDPVKEAFAGEDAVFETDVTSPAAEVFWFKDGEPLEPSDKHEIISDGLKRKLIVHDCKPEDKGRYGCAMDDKRKTFSDLGIQGKIKRIDA